MAIEGLWNAVKSSECSIWSFAYTKITPLSLEMGEMEASLLSFRNKLGLSCYKPDCFFYEVVTVCRSQSNQKQTAWIESLSLEHCLSLWVSIQNCLSVHCFTLHHLLSAVRAVCCSCWAHNWKVWLLFSEVPIKWFGLDWRAWEGRDLPAPFLAGKWYLEMQTSPEQCEVQNIF